MADTPDDADLIRIREALALGRKIDGIKILRECTGCSLTEAKQRIDAMEAGEMDPGVNAGAEERAGAGWTPSAEDVAAISDAIVSGSKLKAVKVLRERTGLGLRDASEAVDRLTVTLSGEAEAEELTAQATKGGCAFLAVALLAVGATVCSLAFGVLIR